MIRVK